MECYSILVDETSDLSNKEQLNLSVRWVDNELEVHEDPLEFIEVEATKGEVLALTIKDALTRMMLPLQKCRGEAYYGAQNMQGKQDFNKNVHLHCTSIVWHIV